MEIVAQVKYLRISPKKIKALGKTVVGLTPKDAIDRLFFMTNKAAKLLAQVVKTAAADAQNNLKQDASTLRIKTVQVLKGPAMKRWQPVSRGMAHSIKKRMSHLKVVLVAKEAEKKIEKPKKEQS